MQRLLLIAWAFALCGWPLHGQYANGYDNRRLLTIPAAQACTGASGTLTNHPVKLERTLAYLATVANGGKVTSAAGNDIRFETTGGTKLDHELVSYTATTGAIYSWVEVPTVNCGSDTTLYVYYGNSGAAAEENPTGVWPIATYNSVWHLEDDPSGGTIADSTANANNGITQGSWTAGDSIAGQAGNGIECRDVDADFLSFTDEKPNPMTLLAWVQGDQTNNASELPVAYDSGSQKAFAINQKDEGSGQETHWVVSNDQTLGDGVAPGGAWTYFVGTANATGRELFVNGTSVGSDAVGLSYGSFGDQRVEMCGGQAGTSFDGRIDEIWLLEVELGADAIRTLWNNYNDEPSFLTIGAEEVSGGSPATYLNKVLIY